MHWVKVKATGVTHYANENIQAPRKETINLTAVEMLGWYWHTVPHSVIRKDAKYFLMITISALLDGRHHHAALSRNKTRLLRYLLSCPTHTAHSWEQAELDLAEALAKSKIRAKWVKHTVWEPVVVPYNFHDARSFQVLGSGAGQQPFWCWLPIDSWHSVSAHQYNAPWTASSMAKKSGGIFFEYRFLDREDWALAKLTG